MENLVNKLLDREIRDAKVAIGTIVGCIDKDRKESRLSDALNAKKKFNKLLK
jgi:hypothetical protein